MRTLWYHDNTAGYPQAGDLSKYAARALILTSKKQKHKIQLPAYLQKRFHQILPHYQRAGLDVCGPEDVAWDTSVPLLLPDYSISCLMFNSKVHAILPNAERYAITMALNDKNNFITYVRDLGYPVPATVIYDAGAIPQEGGYPLPACVKPPALVSGSGIASCSTHQEVLEAVATMQGAYQIQARIDDGIWLNVMYQVIDGIAVHLQTAEQLLDGSEHIGNKPTKRYNPRSITDKLAQAVADAGVEGIFAFDVVYDTKNKCYLLIEANLRWNGATYPFFLSQIVGMPIWQHESIKTSLELDVIVERLDNSGLEHRPGKGGALIVNWSESVSIFTSAKSYAQLRANIAKVKELVRAA